MKRDVFFNSSNIEYRPDSSRNCFHATGHTSVIQRTSGDFGNFGIALMDSSTLLGYALYLSSSIIIHRCSKKKKKNRINGANDRYIFYSPLCRRRVYTCAHYTRRSPTAVSPPPPRKAHLSQPATARAVTRV